MGWVIASIVILGIILIILFMKKIFYSRTSHNYSSPLIGKSSFYDKIQSVGRSIGACCRKMGA